MDRRSFINEALLNNAGASTNCALDDCECKKIQITETQNPKKANSFHFATIIISAFVFAIILSVVKTEAAKTDVTDLIVLKKAKAISCAPGYDKKKLNNNHEPKEGNNQNNCMHQQGSLCETRRRITC